MEIHTWLQLAKWWHLLANPFWGDYELENIGGDRFTIVVRELFLPKETQTRWEAIIRVGGVSRKVIGKSHGNKILW